jgi:hypothetical protein
MKEGLYKVTFTTPRGSGTGLVSIQGGKLRGGDLRDFYLGTYTENGNQVTAQVKTGLHTNTPGTFPVFGRDMVNISLTGTTSGDSVQVTGTAAEAPGLSFQATLRKIAD